MDKYSIGDIVILKDLSLRKRASVAILTHLSKNYIDGIILKHCRRCYTGDAKLVSFFREDLDENYYIINNLDRNIELLYG